MQPNKSKSKKINLIEFDSIKYKQLRQHKQRLEISQNQKKYGHIKYLDIQNAEKISDEEISKIDDPIKEKCNFCERIEFLENGYCQTCESDLTGNPPSIRPCAYDSAKYQLYNTFEDRDMEWLV